MSATSDLIGFAKRNAGIFTTQDAAALGVSQTMLSSRVNDAIFVRVAHGVYALPGTSTRPDLMLRIACQTLGAVVSHESAAKLHGMTPIEVRVPSVTVSHRGTHVLAGVKVHQSTDLLDSHLTTRSGMRITIPERTICDLAKTTGPRRLAQITDHGLATGIVQIDPLVDLFNSLARKGKSGTTTLRRILEARTGPPDVLPSELEFRLLELIARAGLPEPVREFKAPWLKPIDGRIDVAYLAERLVIEADSRKWHALFDAFEVDRRRDNAAQLAGWRVLRFTWRMIVDEPDQVVATIRTALYGAA